MTTTLTERTGADLVDVHAHYAPPVPDDRRAAILATHQRSNFLFPPASKWSPELAIEFMDSHAIRAQLLSNPNQLTAYSARRFNDFGADVVADKPDRFGLLASLPLAEPRVALSEIDRAADDLNTDGFVLITNYGGRYLGDQVFDDIFAALNERAATVFVHPVEPAGFPHLSCGRPGPVIEFPMDTARTVVDAIYARVFLRYPRINFIIAHAGGVLPVLATRIATTGMLGWVPNPDNVTADEIRSQLAGLYYDTALSAHSNSLLPLLETTTASHIVFGSDYPPAGESVIETNMQLLKSTTILDDNELSAMATTATALFPRLARRTR
ncbi:amidohydrolase family protein [Mycolicibacterium sp. 120266]|uniref:amidohydrolase family protein n=1 Tax=Mycolicibacterium sp. 120266 TaxID=3090601 RepID=UPI00299E9654|nr:amidohydrolase family protein [Mycolicibacterium sp. 120266]MDX1872088.1 amidohydrolase family protein [Mycolicibacterium sp. 120266]